jgi:hypothetical protein
MKFINKFILLAFFYLFTITNSAACLMVMPLKEDLKQLASDHFLGEVLEYEYLSDTQVAKIKYKVLKSIFRDTKSIPKQRIVIFTQNTNVTVPKTKQEFIKKYGSQHKVGSTFYNLKMQKNEKYRQLAPAPKENKLPIIIQGICTEPYLVKE